MKLGFPTKYVVFLIKVTSVLLISGGIGLELGNIYAILTHSNMPSIAKFIFGIERFAISAHLIEGVVAAYYASAYNKVPIVYGTYTFFVGTIGLLELFDFLPPPKSPNPGGL
ncbi:MAG: hypothetical protein F6J96_11755 [Symploca sp. SIO1C2]|nr:hypothetical protein [Symploca sp. SIO1C2]